MLAGHWQNLKFLKVKVADTRALAEPWQVLAKWALQPAGFNSPELMIPLLQNNLNASLATISDGPDLLLAMPLMERRFSSSSFSNPLLASGLPHLSKSAPESAMLAFIHAQEKPILLQGIPADGSFIETLKRNTAHFEIIESWQRAALRPTGTYENWLANNFDQKRRKEFKRLRNRLSEQGVLTTETLRNVDVPKPFVDDLLRLEAAGWKGKKGTAINAMPALVESLYEAAASLHKSGKLRFWSLKLDGKSIATLFAIVEGSHAWLGKIAYDEGYSKFSPGVMIIFECTESFFADPAITQVDSSAIPNHPMIDRIWRDRLPMVSVFVAPATVSTLKFKLIVGLEKLRLHSRGLLRDIYYKLKGAKRS